MLGSNSSSECQDRFHLWSTLYYNDRFGYRKQPTDDDGDGDGDGNGDFEGDGNGDGAGDGAMVIVMEMAVVTCL